MLTSLRGSGDGPTGVDSDGGGQGAIKIGNEVVGSFEADGQTHQIGRDTGRAPFGLAELLVRGRPRMDHQALGIPHVGEQRKELSLHDEASRRGFTAPHAEGEDATEPAREMRHGVRVRGMRGEPG